MSWGWNKYRENHQQVPPPKRVTEVTSYPWGDEPKPPERTDGTPPEPEDE